MNLPWYLRKSPILFCIVAGVKFVELIFAIIGYEVWSRDHGTSWPLISRLFDGAIYASAWLASAIIASLLLVVLSRLETNNA